MGEQDLAVKVRGLYARYAGEEDDVLCNVDMTVPNRKLYVVIGASGAGKSTLVKFLIGHITCFSVDCASVLGQPLTKRSRDIGYMPQDAGLIEEISVQETFYIFGRLYGMSESHIAERTRFLLQQLELTHQRDQILRTLSGGQKQRVSLGVSLVHSAPLLVLDEPMSGLDPALRTKQMAYIRRIVDRFGVTVILVSQFMEVASQAHTVALMHEGRLLLENSPRKIIELWGPQNRIREPETRTKDDGTDTGNDNDDHQHTHASDLGSDHTQNDNQQHSNQLQQQQQQQQQQQHEHIPKSIAEMLQDSCSQVCFHFDKCEVIENDLSYRHFFDHGPLHQSPTHAHTSQPQETTLEPHEILQSQNQLVLESSTANDESSHKHLHPNISTLDIREWDPIASRAPTPKQRRNMQIRSVIMSHTHASYRLSALLLMILLFVQPALETILTNTIYFRPIRKFDLVVSSVDNGLEFQGQVINGTALCLDQITNKRHVNFILAHSANETRRFVSEGRALVGIHFKRDFTASTVSAGSSSIVPSADVFVDASEPMTSHQILNDLYEGWYETTKNIRTLVLHDSPNIRQLYSFSQAVVGDLDTPFSSVFGAGLLSSTVLLNGVITALAETTKRNREGVFGRMLLCGMKSSDFMFANVLGFLSITLAQSVVVVGLFLGCFGYRYVLTLRTFAGMFLVLAASIPTCLIASILFGLIARNQTQSLTFTLAAFLFGSLFSGAYWSQEAQPYLPFRVLGLLTPNAWACAGLQAALLYPESGVVWEICCYGLGVMGVWCVAGWWLSVRRISGLMAHMD